jgi:hypothetical protein
MSVITIAAKDEIKHLKSEDVVAAWGGANNINKDNTKGAIKYIRNFSEERRKANIVSMNAPHRYDLVNSSCVNNEVVNLIDNYRS